MKIYAHSESEFNAHLKESISIWRRFFPTAFVYSKFGKRSSILSYVFASKQSNAEVTVPHSCMPESNFTSFTFWSTEAHKLLNELNSFGMTDPIGFFPQFYCSFLEI